jgi:ribonuclease BN (tRNA processing enzyme)|nr:MAG TPA: RNaseZ [Caudoviricetes sp.]
MNYNIISTGSQGNAVVLNDCILIDCGVSFKALKEVYKGLKLVLLTHLHSDHFRPQTLKRLADERATLRFGCCQWLVKPLIDAGIPKQSIDVYEIGKIYDYKAFKVSPIKLYHNVPNSGYRVFANGEKAIYATDTGHLQGITAKGYDLYMLEANYDEDDLEQRIREKTATGQYCYELNVAERHLSHTQASEWLLANMKKNSEYVFLHQHQNRDKPKEWEYADT